MGLFMLPPDGKHFERVSDPKEIKGLQAKGWVCYRRKKAAMLVKSICCHPL